MNEKQSVPESSKAVAPQNGGGNVGQYVPQVFMVPYYAPPPGFSGYSSGQQHPQMPQQVFGQMPQGTHPAAMPVSGMQPLPIGPMAPIPMPTMVNSTTASSPTSRPSVQPSEQGPSKTTAGDEKSERAQNNYQMPILRACWTLLEEEILVKTYAEFTIGKKLKKISRKTWETIAKRLFHESKKQMPQVSMKSWMQCKDKWNNMIKKHRVQKSEYAKGTLNDGNTREKSSLHDAMERVLCYEAGGEYVAYSGQENQFIVEDDGVTMVAKSGQLHSGSETVGHERLSSRLGREGCQENNEKNPASEEVITQNGDEYGHQKQVDKHTDTLYSNNFENDDESDIDEQESNCHVTYSHPTPKRKFTENDNDSNDKRARVLDEEEEECVSAKLCQIMTHQTELLERMHTQHCELMQQVQMSEENTRTMVMQAIKDIGTILNKMIKSEQF